MDLADLFNETPFMELLGIEVTHVEPGYAEGELPFGDHLRPSNYGKVVHGGATYALADTVGGAAVVAQSEDVCPTVDMRIDYLAPVTDDLFATAEVIRYGSNLAVSHVDLHDPDDNRVATAQGTYKTGGQGAANPWYNEDDEPPAATE